ncbi:hypothetical protein JYT22_01125, partial [Endomicrobium sp. AH-315-J14]|nr:hypothetical protein [Endomicrobium sp. AH-315-J14]
MAHEQLPHFQQRRAVQIDALVAGLAWLPKGIVLAFDPHTGAPKALWREREKKTQWEPEFGAGNQVTLDENGHELAFADGPYRLLFYPAGTDVSAVDPGANPPLLNGVEADDTTIVVKFVINKVFWWEDVVLNAKDFGAVGDGLVDDAPALQRAIDYCVANTDTRLYLPPGRYRIRRSLIIARPVFPTDAQGKPTGSNDIIGYAGISMEIFGPSRGYSISAVHQDAVILADIGRPPEPDPTDTAKTIEVTTNDQPAVIIQGGVGVVLRDLTITGANNWMPDLDGDITKLLDFSREDFVVNDCRDKPYSPYAGIAIDPFHPYTGSGMLGGFDPSQGYPRLEKFYANLEKSKVAQSSSCSFENLAIEFFVVGVVISPTGRTTNAENIVLRSCNIKTVRVGVNICQPQSRNVLLQDIICSGFEYFVSTNNYGIVIQLVGGAVPAGTAPTILGANVGVGKYLFNVAISSQGFLVSGLYAEAFLSIGYVGIKSVPSNCARFEGCQFNFFDTGFTPADPEKGTPEIRRRVIDTHLWSYGSVSFADCVLATNAPDRGAPIRFFNNERLHLVDCSLVQYDGEALPLGGTLPLGFNDFDMIELEGVRWIDNSLPEFDPLTTSYLNRQYRSKSEARLMRWTMPPGAVILHRPSGSHLIRLNADQQVPNLQPGWPANHGGAGPQAPDVPENTQIDNDTVLDDVWHAIVTLFGPGEVQATEPKQRLSEGHLHDDPTPVSVDSFRYVAQPVNEIDVQRAATAASAPQDPTVNVNVFAFGADRIKFPLPSGEKLLKRGDLLYVADDSPTEFIIPGGFDPYHANEKCSGPIGRVTDITAGIVTADQVPQSFLPDGVGGGIFKLVVRYFGRYHGSARILAFSPQFHNRILVHPVGSFKKNDRIWGQGIPEGTYVTKVFEVTVKINGTGASTLVLSQDVVVDEHRAWVWDADVRYMLASRLGAPPPFLL